MAEMTLSQIQAISTKRAGRWHPCGIGEWTVSDWAVAMAGEAGEMCNAVKKLNRLRTGAQGANNPTSEAAAVYAIGEELADTVLYAVLVAQRLEIPLAAAVAAKFNAVSRREGFPERMPIPGADEGIDVPAE